MKTQMELWHEKLDLIEKAYENTKEQKDAIEGKKEEKFERLLKKRLGIFRQIDVVDRLLKELGMGEVGNEIQQIEALYRNKIKEITALDEMNYKKAQNHKEELTNQIKKLNVGKKAMNNGYFKPMNSLNGYYFDTKK